MSYKDSVRDTYYSQFTNDEKIAYALNLSLAKITIDAFKSGYEWYKSPDLYEAVNKQSILSKSVPSYIDIRLYYCIITVNNVEYITNKTVDNILTWQGGFKLSELLGTNAEILSGLENEYSDSPSGTEDFESNGLCNKIPRQAFAFFVYWKNKLTGKGGNGSTAGVAGSGTWPFSDDSLSVKLTLNSSGDIDANRTYANVLGNASLMSSLKAYAPLKIINPSFIEGTIDQANGIPDSLKPYVLKDVVINVGVPTISTWNGSPNSNYSDNIAFFNPLLTKSLNETYGYNGNQLGNGYWIRGTDNNRTNIRPDYGSAAVDEGTMIFSSMTGFVLFFGVSDILTNSVGVSVINPPCVTALRYIGETFADGIISQGDTLPDAAVSKDKDLFINTSTNTIHRFGGNSWFQLGGGGIGITDSVPLEMSAGLGAAKFNTGNSTLYINTGTEWQSIQGGADNSKYHPSNAPVQLLLPIITQMKDFMEALVFSNNKKQTLLNILTQQPETFTLDASYNKGNYISDASNVILRWNYDDIMIHQDGKLTNQLSLFDKATNIPHIDEIFIDISGSMTDNSWNEIKRFSVDDYNTDEFKTFTIKNNDSLKYSRRVYNSFLKGDEFQIGIYGKNNAKNYRLKEDRMLIFDCSFAYTADVPYNINTFQITIADLSGNIGNLNFTKNAENNAVLLKKVHHADMSGNWMKPYDLSGVKTDTQSYKWMTFKIDKNSFYIKTAKHKLASTTINYIDVPLFMKHEGFTATEINHFGNNTSFIDSSGIVGFIQIKALDYNSADNSKVCHFMKNTRTNPMQVWYAGLNPSDISLSHLLDETNGKYYGGLVDTGNYIVDNWGIQCPSLHKFTSDIYLVIGIKIE